MKIENLIGLDIIDILCEKFDYNTTGYTTIVFKFTNCYLEFTVDDDTDEINNCIKDKIDEIGLFTPEWAMKVINKKLVQLWYLKNDKKYDDLICIGIGELIPTLIFCTIASEIKVGFANYIEG